MMRRRATSPQQLKATKLRFGAAVGAGIGALVSIAALSPTETVAEGAGPGGHMVFGAGPGGPDGGALSTYVAHAQRGEVVPPDLDDVEHMCGLLTSCDKLPLPPSMIPADFQSCVKKFTDEFASPAAIYASLVMRECGLQSNSCASLRACALHGANPDACQGRGSKSSVVGFCDVDGRAISCWNNQILGVRDCTRGGEQCIAAGGEAKCTLGPCPGTIKDGDKPQCSASGTHKVQCEKGKLVSVDCATFGLHCTTAPDGTAGCTTSGNACSGTAKRCDGNTAVGCFNGHEVRVDCAAGGMTCSPAPGTTPVGACVSASPPVGSCDPSEKARCDGANIKYCFAGKQRSYFCKALGFNKCEQSGGAKSGLRCAM